MCAQHCLQSSPPPRPSIPDGAHGVQCILVVVVDEVPRSRGWLEPPGWDRAEPGVLRLWVHRRAGRHMQARGRRREPACPPPRERRPMLPHLISQSHCTGRPV